jgi:hypothetical protein
VLSAILPSQRYLVERHTRRGSTNVPQSRDFLSVAFVLPGQPFILSPSRCECVPQLFPGVYQFTRCFPAQHGKPDLQKIHLRCIFGCWRGVVENFRLIQCGLQLQRRFSIPQLSPLAKSVVEPWRSGMRSSRTDLFNRIEPRCDR